MSLVQLLLFGIMFAIDLSLAPIGGTLAKVVFQVLTVTVGAVVAIFVVLWTKGGVVERTTASVCSLISLVFATNPAWIWYPFSTSPILYYRSIRNAFPMVVWLFIVACLLAILVIVNMRSHRTEEKPAHAGLIVSDAQNHAYGSLLGEAACIAAPGWVFLPYFVGSRTFMKLQSVDRHSYASMVLIAAFVIVAWLFLLMVNALFDAARGSRRLSRAGMTLLPFMFAGLAVAGVVVVTQAAGI